MWPSRSTVALRMALLPRACVMHSAAGCGRRASRARASVRACRHEPVHRRARARSQQLDRPPTLAPPAGGAARSTPLRNAPAGTVSPWRVKGAVRSTTEPQHTSMPCEGGGGAGRTGRQGMMQQVARVAGAAPKPAHLAQLSARSPPTQALVQVQLQGFGEGRVGTKGHKVRARRRRVHDRACTQLGAGCESARLLGGSGGPGWEMQIKRDVAGLKTRQGCCPGGPPWRCRQSRACGPRSPGSRSAGWGARRRARPAPSRARRR